MSPSELLPSAPCMLQRALSYSCISSSSFGTVTLETAPNPYQNTGFFLVFPFTDGTLRQTGWLFCFCANSSYFPESCYCFFFFSSEKGNCSTNVAPVLSSPWIDIFFLILKKAQLIRQDWVVHSESLLAKVIPGCVGTNFQIITQRPPGEPRKERARCLQHAVRQGTGECIV